MVAYLDNPRSADAAYALYEQFKKIEPYVAGNSAETFYRALITLSVHGYQAHVITRGKNKGKLTLAKLVEGNKVADARIVPVDFINVPPPIKVLPPLENTL